MKCHSGGKRQYLIIDSSVVSVLLLVWLFSPECGFIVVKNCHSAQFPKKKNAFTPLLNPQQVSNFFTGSIMMILAETRNSRFWLTNFMKRCGYNNLSANGFFLGEKLNEILRLSCLLPIQPAHFTSYN